MNTDLLIVLGLLISSVVMFVLNKPRMDVVALIMITALPLTGVITMPEALAGFADSNIILIAALFIIGEGLVRTGVARSMGDLLIKKAGTSEIRLLVFLMIAVCGLGSLMSSTAVVAIFIPVALRIAQTTGTAPSRLMMPLCYAALISGMTTLVATAPNLVVNSELVRQGKLFNEQLILQGKPPIDPWEFSFFSFTPFGVPILVVGILYMLFARRFLGTGDKSAADATSTPARPRASLSNWIEEYKLTDREHRLRVLPGSPVVGKTLTELNLRSSAGASIIAIERTARSSTTLIEPGESTELHAGDILLLDVFSPTVKVESLRDQYQLESLPLPASYFSDRSQDIGLAEVIVPADSHLNSQTLVDARFRSRTGLTVIGLRRTPALEAGALTEEKLRTGDTLLVVGPWKRIERLATDDSGVVITRLPTEIDEVLPVAGRLWHALGCLAVVVILMITGWVPNVQAAFIGVLLMMATGCIDITSAYRCINWKTIVLIVGMLPFSIALQRTGGVDLAANALQAATAGSGHHVVLAALFAITAGLGLFISNTATAVLMAPVAIAIAKDMGASPYPFAMIVALAASTAFMTPISSPVCTLVVAPGGYKFGDFVKIGVPLSILVMIISVFMVPWLLPLNLAK